MPKKHIVELTEEQREKLRAIVRETDWRQRQCLHAQILLDAECGPCASDQHYWTDKEISDSHGVSISTIERVRKRFAEEGFDRAVNHRSGWLRHSRSKI